MLWTENEQRLYLTLGWLHSDCLKPAAVNVNSGSLESKKGSKLVLIGALFLPPPLTQAPLWATGCLKLVTAAVFQPLFRGQHADFT